MSVPHKLRSLLWKKDTAWRELAVIASAIVVVVGLIGLVR